MSVGPLPVNLLIGAGLLVAGYANLGGEKYSEHFNNLGNGFVGSYLAATGFAFGKRWKETGKILGGGGHPWTHPYENGWPKGGAETPPPPQSSGWTNGAYVGAGDLVRATDGCHRAAHAGGCRGTRVLALFRSLTARISRSGPDAPTHIGA